MIIKSFSENVADKFIERVLCPIKSKIENLFKKNSSIIQI